MLCMIDNLLIETRYILNRLDEADMNTKLKLQSQFKRAVFSDGQQYVTKR